MVGRRKATATQQRKNVRGPNSRTIVAALSSTCRLVITPRMATARLLLQRSGPAHSDRYACNAAGPSRYLRLTEGTMQSKRQQKLARIRLVARVRVAYEQLRDCAVTGRGRAAAVRRLSALNRALALLAAQDVTHPALG